MWEIRDSMVCEKKSLNKIRDSISSVFLVFVGRQGKGLTPNLMPMMLLVNGPIPSLVSNIMGIQSHSSRREIYNF